jgi:3-hydroxybutyryl-CoA dehydrogenase
LTTANLLVSLFFAKNTLMQIVVLSNDTLTAELLGNSTNKPEGFTFIDDVHQFAEHKNADVFVDLLFENEAQRIQLLQQLLPKTVIINSVTDTLNKIDEAFVRINAWPTFLQGPIVEASATRDDAKKKTEILFSLLNKTVEWLPDAPGFVSARVISMIINEAFFALEEGVSTPQEIDTAMKLGTAYPYGPFEWSNKIGLQNIVNLLTALSHQNSSYTPNSLLLQETDKAI